MFSDVGLFLLVSLQYGLPFLAFVVRLDRGLISVGLTVNQFELGFADLALARRCNVARGRLLGLGMRAAVGTGF